MELTTSFTSLSHTSSNEATQQQIKCKAKACRNSGLDFLAKNLKSIHTVIVDGCSSGTKSINDSISETLSSKCQHPTHDLWHKEKNMTKEWNKNMRKRSHKRGPLLFPTLSKRKSQQRI
jgi:hypothetical protein